MAGVYNDRLRWLASLFLLILCSHAAVDAANEVHVRGSMPGGHHHALALIAGLKELGAHQFASQMRADDMQAASMGYELDSDLLAQLNALPGARELQRRIREQGFSYPGEEDAPEFGYVNEVGSDEQSRDEDSFLGTESSMTKNADGAAVATVPQDEPASVQVMKQLGTPKSGIFTSHGVYLKRTPAGLWLWAAAKSLDSSTWYPCSAASVAPSSARSFLSTVNQVQPVPRASTDVLEVLGKTDDNGVYAFDAGIGVTELYFRYVGGGAWEWSPDKAHWMATNTHVVSGGRWRGQKPVQENRDIIDALEVYQLTGKGNLPKEWNQSWWEKSAREVWRKANHSTLGHVMSLKGKLEEVVNMVNGIKFPSFKVPPQVKLGGKGALRAVYGFLDGVFLGMMDHIAHAFHDPSCHIDSWSKEVDGASARVGSALKTLLLEVGHIHKIVPNARATWDAMADLMSALLSINEHCPSFGKTMFPMLTMLAVGLVLTVGIAATGYGVVFKIGMALVSLVMAGPFLVKSVKRSVTTGSALLDSLNGAVAEIEKSALDFTEDVSRVGGVIYGIIVLTKEVIHEGPHAVQKLLNSKFGKALLGKFGTTPKALTADFQTFAGKIKQFRAGDTTGVKEMLPKKGHGHGSHSLAEKAWHQTMEKGHTTHILEAAEKAVHGGGGHHGAGTGH